MFFPSSPEVPGFFGVVLNTFDPLFSLDDLR